VGPAFPLPRAPVGRELSWSCSECMSIHVHTCTYYVCGMDILYLDSSPERNSSGRPGVFLTLAHMGPPSKTGAVTPHKLVGGERQGGVEGRSPHARTPGHPADELAPTNFTAPSKRALLSWRARRYLVPERCRSYGSPWLYSRTLLPCSVANNGLAVLPAPLPALGARDRWSTTRDN
jgi:hypothetical protein